MQKPPAFAERRIHFMSISETRLAELNTFCHRLRSELIDTLHSVQTGHPGGSLSCCEILVTLYFHHLRIDPETRKWKTGTALYCPKGMRPPCCIFALPIRDFFPWWISKPCAKWAATCKATPAPIKPRGRAFYRPIGSGAFRFGGYGGVRPSKQIGLPGVHAFR